MNIQPVGFEGRGITEGSLNTNIMDKANEQAQKDISDAELLTQKQILFQKQKKAYELLLQQGVRAADIYKADVVRKYKDDVDNNGEPIVARYLPPPEVFVTKETGKFDPQKWLEHAYVGVTKYEENRDKRAKEQQQAKDTQDQIRAIEALGGEAEKGGAALAAAGVTGLGLTKGAQSVVTALPKEGTAQAAKDLAEYRKLTLAVKNRIAGIKARGVDAYSHAQVEDDYKNLLAGVNVARTRKDKAEEKVLEARSAVDKINSEYDYVVKPEDKIEIDRKKAIAEAQVKRAEKIVSEYDNDILQFEKSANELGTFVAKGRAAIGATPQKPTQRRSLSTFDQNAR